MSEQAPSRRLDQWLFVARLCKSRRRAGELIEAGRVRVNRVVVTKRHFAVRPGHILTLPQGPHIRVVKVSGLGETRRPAQEARQLYYDLEPPRTST